mmetsp:Transcript_35272/g.56752  ORF Transcript_35272/g.56752 Transcript_35272/m.56752 type:complete len:259 (+) Transcript_35272:59-835(+)
MFSCCGDSSSDAKAAQAMDGTPTLGYWKIRGLAAPLRMMFYYKGQKFNLKAYGEDAKDKWFGEDKPKLCEKNAMMNLPYLIDGETVVTQSNSCLLYLGKKLKIDVEECFIHNHQALDQITELRNDLMKVVYGGTKEELPADMAKHMQGPAAGHLGKLEGFCKGPFLCGGQVQSADFHMFEMLDQHTVMCSELKSDFDFKKYPKLLALHKAMKEHPALSKYFAADCYTKYAFNNVMYTRFVGPGFEGAFGPTTEKLVEF